MAMYLHTMVRVTDPERSREFYEALGMEFRRDLPIVRDGELEATNYFFGFPGDEAELELTFNHDGRTYELGTSYGPIRQPVADLRRQLDRRAAGRMLRSPHGLATYPAGGISLASRLDQLAVGLGLRRHDTPPFRSCLHRASDTPSD
jgi:lactoylglutathione lyase